MPLDARESMSESDVLGRLSEDCSSSFLMVVVATWGLWKREGNMRLLRKEEVVAATRPIRRPAMEAHAKNT